MAYIGETNMADITASDKNYVSIIGRAANFLASLDKSKSDRRLYEKTLNELEDMSDHELADLGMSRETMHEVVHKAVYGK